MVRTYVATPPWPIHHAMAQAPVEVAIVAIAKNWTRRGVAKDSHATDAVERGQTMFGLVLAGSKGHDD